MKIHYSLIGLFIEGRIRKKNFTGLDKRKFGFVKMMTNICIPISKQVFYKD